MNSHCGYFAELPHRGTRRDFLRLAALASGAAAVTFDGPATLAGAKQEHGLVDVNVSLGRWPVRRLPWDNPGRLVEKLHSRGVTQAWAGSFEGLLHKDLAAVNARLAEECQKHGRGFLLPFGSVNPKLPRWEKDLETCAETHRMAGVRLHPNYHGYGLDDPEFGRLLRLAAERRLIAQLALLMEDERMMHPRLRVPPVDISPLTALLERTPGLRLVLLNALGVVHGERLRKLLASGMVHVEVSMLEGVGGLDSLLRQVPAERVLFGSHVPLFYFDAAELKLKESLLTAEQIRIIASENARRLLGA